MGVEPTLDQEAGRATVLETVQAVPQPAPRALGSFQTGGFVRRLRQADPRLPPVRLQKWLHGDPIL